MAWYMIEARASDGDWLAIDSTFDRVVAERMMADDYMMLVTRIVEHTNGISHVVASHIPPLDECNDETWMLDDVDRDQVPVMAIDGWPIYRAKDY